MPQGEGREGELQTWPAPYPHVYLSGTRRVKCSCQVRGGESAVGRGLRQSHVCLYSSSSFLTLELFITDFDRSSIFQHVNRFLLH